MPVIFRLYYSLSQRNLYLINKWSVVSKLKLLIAFECDIILNGMVDMKSAGRLKPLYKLCIPLNIYRYYEGVVSSEEESVPFFVNIKG